MKKIFLILSIIALSVSCTSKYEDDIVELGNRIDKLEQKIPTIEQQISAIDESITLLKQTDEALRAKDEQLTTEDEKLKMAIQELEILIAELEKYVIYPAKDWAEATFYTLKQYNAAVSTLAKLEQSIASSDDATSKEISDAISALQASFQTWVGKELSGYYSIARADAEFAALQQSIESGDQTLQGEIDAVESQIANSATELEKEYQTAIETAIEEYNGTITAELKSQLDDVNKRIDEQVAAINDKLDALEAQIDKNSEDIAKLLARIQSISYIHKYADGKATMRQLDDLRHAVLQFEVSPKESVAALAESWENVLSVRGICPSDDGIIFDVDMPILKFETDEENGIISITISGENYPDWIFAEKEETMVVLTISNGATTFTTDYIPMAIRDYGGYDELIMPSNEIWYITSDEHPIALHDDEPFNTEVLSNTYENGFGRIVTDGEIKSLSYNTFSDAQLLSITIPDSVSNIADGTFNAGSIVEFRYKHASQDGRSIIMNNRLVAVAAGGLTEYTIPDSVTEIGDYTFYNCTSLESITIGNGVTSIGARAFGYCTSLTSFTIPESVIEIGYRAFEGCTGELTINSKIIETDYIYGSTDSQHESEGWLYQAEFTQITIGDNITKIGDKVFSRYKSLTSVTIPDSVTEIGEKAFYWCDSLISITIPDSVISIGDFAFYDCTSLKSITIGNGVNEIVGNAFGGCQLLKRVDISDLSAWCRIKFDIEASVTGISATNPLSYGAELYLNGTLVTDVVIPSDIAHINDAAFLGCSSLTSVTIPDSVTSIGDYAFYLCTSLTSVTIPDSVTAIGDRVFSGCGVLNRTNIHLSKLEDYMTNRKMYEDIPGKYLYVNGQEVVDMVVPNGVTTIENKAFRGLACLKSVTIPLSVTAIGDYAFEGCIGLTSVHLAKTITSIGSYAFANCTGLTSCDIPVSVTSIGYKAFANCINIPSFEISASVNSIGAMAFSGCTGELIINSKIVETNYTKDDYPEGYRWLSGSNFTKLTIGNNVTKIGDYVFYSCRSLTSVTIPDSVTSIGDYVFYNCYLLESITIGNSVTSIGDYAFYDNRFESITIPESVTSIGGSAFKSCDSLTSITIPDSVTEIGDYAFQSCNNLREVYCKRTTPPSIGEYTFDTYASGRKIYVPTASVEAYKSALNWSYYSGMINGYNFE